MRAEFVNPFLLSLMNVMSTMAQVELKPGAPRKKNDDVARGDVSGLIGMVGPQTKGSFSITFDKSLALEVMRRMLGEAPTTINDEVTDIFGTHNIIYNLPTYLPNFFITFSKCLNTQYVPIIKFIFSNGK